MSFEYTHTQSLIVFIYSFLFLVFAGTEMYDLENKIFISDTRFEVKPV